MSFTRAPSFGRRFLFDYITCATQNEEFYYDILDLMSEIFERHFQKLQSPDEPEIPESQPSPEPKEPKKGLEITITTKRAPEPAPALNETLFQSFHSQLAAIPFEQFLKLIESKELFSDILFHIFILNNKKLNSATDRFSFSPEIIRGLLEQKGLGLGTFLAESSKSQYINDNLVLGMDFLDSFLWSLDELLPGFDLDELCDQVIFRELD